MWNEDVVRDEVIPLVRSVLVERASNLDVDRVYCNGISMGAHGAFLAALHGANLFSIIAASSPANLLDIVTARAPWSSVGGKKLQKIVVATGSIDRVHIKGGRLIRDGPLLNDEFLDFLKQTGLESEITIDHHTYDGGDHYIWTSFDNRNEPWLWAGEHPFALEETSVAVHDFPV
jgi:enterochelin esterase-like enzyme